MIDRMCIDRLERIIILYVFWLGNGQYTLRGGEYHRVFVFIDVRPHRIWSETEILLFHVEILDL